METAENCLAATGDNAGLVIAAAIVLIMGAVAALIFSRRHKLSFRVIAVLGLLLGGVIFSGFQPTLTHAASSSNDCQTAARPAGQQTPPTNNGETPSTPETPTPNICDEGAQIVPVANDDTVEAFNVNKFQGQIIYIGYLETGQPNPTNTWTTTILANDTVAGGVSLDPATVDIDPSTPGVQQSLTTSSFTANYNQANDTYTVVVTDPDTYYVDGGATSTTSYTVRTECGTLSNTATLTHPGGVSDVEV